MISGMIPWISGCCWRLGKVWSDVFPYKQVSSAIRLTGSSWSCYVLKLFSEQESRASNFWRKSWRKTGFCHSTTLVVILVVFLFFLVGYACCIYLPSTWIITISVHFCVWWTKICLRVNILTYKSRHESPSVWILIYHVVFLICNCWMSLPNWITHSLTLYHLFLFVFCFLVFCNLRCCYSLYAPRRCMIQAGLPL